VKQRFPLRELDFPLTCLVAAAKVTAREARRKYREHHRFSHGAVLRPGTDTPLWNELAREAAAQLRYYAGKRASPDCWASRASGRISSSSQENSRPDAGRTLQLLAWLPACRRASIPCESSVLPAALRHGS
jgi:hypothetical protein